MKRKRILTVLIVLALVFIWGNSLVSRELSGKISDDILFFLNAAAEKVGLGPDAFTYMTDEDGDGVAEQPTSHLIRKAAHVTEYAVFAALLFLRLGSRHADRRDRRNAPDILPPRQSGAGRAHRHRRRAAGSRRRNVDFIFN